MNLKEKNKEMRKYGLGRPDGKDMTQEEITKKLYKVAKKAKLNPTLKEPKKKGKK